MALLKYFKKVESCEYSVPNVSSSHSTSHNMPAQKADKELKKKCRGSYIKFSPEEKANIARYASEHGVSKAVKRYSDKGVKESSVRDWLMG